MVRDTSVTRARLMSAAHDEFAAYGIAGARVDRIAQVAGVNKQRIYGLFGSKEALFEAVMNEAMEEHTKALGVPADDAVDYLARIYDFHRDHPELLRLLMWEALYYDAADQELPGEKSRAEHYIAKVAALAKSTGTPRSPCGDQAPRAHRPRHAAAMLPQLTRMIIEPYAEGPDAEAQMREHLLHLAQRAFATPEQE